jgi:Xaa-Pro dipeptidase
MLVNEDRAKRMMEKYGLDALIAATPENILYLGGYGTPESFHFAPQGFGAVIYPMNANLQPVLIVHSWELPAVEMSWIEEVRLQNTSDVAITDRAVLDDDEQYFRDAWQDQRNAPSNRQEVIARTICELGLQNGRLGCDDVRVMLDLKANYLKFAEFIDAVNIFREIRIIKTAEEITRLERAAKVTETVLAGLAELARPGRTVQELLTYCRSVFALMGGYASHGIGNGRGRPWVSFPNFDYRLKDGDFLYVDPAGEVDRYWGDVGRTLTVGTSRDKRLEEYLASIEQCHEKIAPMLVPGTATNEVKAEAKRIMEGRLPLAGFSPLVHSIGLEQYDHPQTIGEFLTDDFVLEENMVVNLETPYSELGWGILQLEDTYHVSTSGARRLTSLTRGPLRSRGG